MSRVSVVVCVFDKLDYTGRCLETLLAERSPLLREIVVVDNGSTDGTAEYLATLPELVKVVSPGENLGFVGGNNLGAEHATGEYLVLLNNDTEPRPGWLEGLVETAERDETVGAVGAKLIYPDGRLQEAGGIVFSDASGWNYGRGDDPADPRYGFVRDVDYCSGACLLVRADLWRELGGFDERYAPAYYEDTDLCFAIRAAGKRVVFQPRAEVVHHEGATAGTDTSSGFKRFQEVNRGSFAAKWAEALREQHPPHPALVRRASDRAPGKRILVADPTMPAYDRASGLRRLHELLKLLRAEGHAVTFLALNGLHADRYRPELEQLGIEVYAGDPGRLAQVAWEVDLPRLLGETGYDVAWLDFFHLAEEYLGTIRALSPRTRILIDTVDVHFVRERREAELLGHDDGHVEQTRRRELAIYAQADALVAVTEDDRAVLLEELPEATVHVIPNVHELPEPGPGVDGRDGLLFVGNFNHLPNRDAVRHLCEDVLPLVRAEAPGTKLTIVGNKPPPEIEALAGDGVDVVGWVPDLRPYLDSHRISVAPLRYGAGMKGKIGEALAHGLPVVSTSIGAEGMVEDGEPALLVADDARSFADAILRLGRDDALWQQLSTSGRSLVDRRWTPAAVSSRLAELLEQETARRVDPDLTSILILAHGGLELTKACLDSIERCTPEPHELILVDNASPDDTRAFLREYAASRPHVVVVANEENRGFAGGNNQALALARGGTICLLNNDVVVTPGWLGRLRATLERHPDVGLVGPMSNHVTGPQLVRDVPYRTPQELDAFAADWAAAHDGQTETTSTAIGFCLLVRRDVVDRIGGLDERFGVGNFEDDDYSVRALQEGFGILIARDAFVHHEGSKTFDSIDVDYGEVMLGNWGRFKAKWGLPPEIALGERFELDLDAMRATCGFEPLPLLGSSHEPTDGRWWQQRTEPISLKAPMRPIAIDTSSVESLRLAFAETAAWQDPHRRYQMRRQLAERVLGSETDGDWMQTFAATAGCLLDALEEDPCEPVLLNVVGVLLYELTELRAAEAMFKAAARLEPDLEHLKANLRAVRQLKGRVRSPLRGQIAAEVVQLGARARRVASLARPATGLTLSLCMIVKDEEEMLPGCLEPVHRHVDELIVVDTGSTDRTVEIAESFGAKVIHFPWNGSFADARNVGLDAATGDWLLYLDADEHLLPEDAPKLRQLLGRTWREAFYLVETNYTGRDELGSAVTHMALRLFRNRPEYRFEGRIHEQKTQNMPTYLPERFEQTTIRMLHYGYLKSRVRDREKSRRNIALLEREAREAPTPFTSFNLGSEYMDLDDVAEARRHFEDAWQQLGSGWHEVGYGSILVARLGSVRRVDGDIEGARAVLAQGLAVYADHTDLIFELALCAFESGDLAEAERLVRRCLEIGDAPAEYIATAGKGTHLALGLLAEIQRACGNAAGAEESWRRSLADHPDYVMPLLPLATAMLARGATAEEVAAVVPPERPSAMLLVGTAFHEAGQAGEAESWFRAALERQPSNSVARIGVIEALLSQRRYTDAAAEAAAEPIDSPLAAVVATAGLFAHAVLADADGLAGALDRARAADVAASDLALYEAWLAALVGERLPDTLPGDAAPTLLTALEALLRVQEFDAFELGARLLERVDLDPRERRELLARMYLRRGFLESAADEWVAAAQAGPDAQAYVGLAQVAFARGLADDSISFLEAALELEPGNADAGRMLQGVQRLAA